MIITIIVLILILLYYVTNIYLKEYIEVTRIFKTLRKMLNYRDVTLLKILPDIKDKKKKEKVMNLIDERNKKYKISYDDAIVADVELNNELKNVYLEIDKMQKNDLQLEVFKRLMLLEKQINNVRKKYTNAVEKYNLSLTIHPKVCVKLLHMRPLDIYKK